ncbi:MAG: serine hydrolase domain-containing protein [Actinomycetes bacterium]
MNEIRGTVAPGFEEVRDVFAENFTSRGEVGAGFCVYVDGTPVVDLTGGVADTSGTPYDDSTLQMVFSTTKGATAMCAHLLAQRGQLDLLAPVREYWPEFAANGKEDVPVAWLLSHKVGLPDVDRPMTLDEALDWDAVARALAESAPVWEPGTQHGYHALTFGWLVGELVRRVSGTSIGEFFATEFAAPLGLEFWIGLPAEQQRRVADLIPMDAPEGLPMMMSEEGTGQDAAPGGLIAMLDMFLGEGNLAARALTAPGGAFSEELIWNEDRVRAAQIPAANGVTNAPSLARLYAACVGNVDGVRLLDDATITRAIEVQSEGPDSVLIFPIPFAFGFMRHSQMSPFAGPRSFGHYGAGGSVGFADPDRRLAVGYVMNKMHFGLAGHPRTAALIEVVDRLVG